MSKQRLLVIIGMLVVGGLLVASAVLWWVATHLPDVTSTKNGVGSVQQYSNQQDLVDQVNQKTGVKDYAGAIRLIEGQKDAETSVDLQLLLAGAYANSGDYQKSLDVYKKLQSSGKLPASEYVNMGDIAAMAKDYQTAIDAYKKAKDAAESDDETATLNNKIADMEKKL